MSETIPGTKGKPGPDLEECAKVVEDIKKMSESDTPRKPFRAGDTVKHIPAGEEWVLANDEENGKVSPSGWPESLADASDCELVKAATDEERLAELLAWSAKGKGVEHENDHRTATARRQLEKEKTMSESDTPETNGEVNEHLGASTFGMVTADFARRLERERNEARAQRDELLNAIREMQSRTLDRGIQKIANEAITKITKGNDEK